MRPEIEDFKKKFGTSHNTNMESQKQIESKSIMRKSCGIDVSFIKILSNRL